MPNLSFDGQTNKVCDHETRVSIVIRGDIRNPDLTRGTRNFDFQTGGFIQ
jgi:hypothetical protein